jgi:hypothetical protein
MPVIVDRETLGLDLRTYGEDELARRVAAIDDEVLARIHERADHYLYGEANGLIAKAATLAAIEVLEGTARQPRWKRRKLKGIWPEEAREPLDATDEGVDRREVERAIATALREAGYQKPPGDRGVFVKQLTDDVRGRVGYFIQRLRTGELEVTPTVGVRHERIHDLIDGLEERKGSRTEPTATIILGYLLPQKDPNLVWRFDRETSADDVAAGLVEHVVRFGEPWMRERVSQESIIEEVRADRRVNPERLPAALLLAGRPDEARAALEAELNEARGRTDAAAQNFRRFAERFRAEVFALTADSSETGRQRGDRRQRG